MPTWPTAGGFPQRPRARTWTRQRQDILDRFNPALGPERTRKRTTGAIYLCTGSFVLTYAKRVTLETFWRDDCEQGALSFTWTDPEDPSLVRTWEWAEAPAFARQNNGEYLASVSLNRR